MSIKRILAVAVSGAILAALITACTIKYTLSGASIPPAAKTVSVAYFPNNAPMVAPTLSSTLTDALQEKFTRMTKLELVRDGGDLAFEGEIVNYVSTPSSVTADHTAAMNRLTITVKVRFTNMIEPSLNYNKTFTQFEDFDTSMDLMSAEPSLIPQIVEKLVDDIFNAAVANW